MLLTRMVLNRKKFAGAVLAAIRIHGPKVAAKLDQTFAPMRRDGQAIPDFAGDLADLENNLVAAYDKIEAADDVHLKNVAEDRRLRRLREVVAKRLQQVLLKVSQTIDSSYGPFKAEEYLGLGPGLRPIPDQIFDVGRRARDSLADPEFEFKEAAIKGVALIPVDLHTEIDEPLGELAEVLETVREAKREFDDTLQVKLTAIEEFNTTFTMVATWLKGMFLGAGEIELAKRIRPRIPVSSKAKDEQVVEVDDKTGEEKEVDPDGSSSDGSSSDGSSSDSSGSSNQDSPDQGSGNSSSEGSSGNQPASSS